MPTVTFSLNRAHLKAHLSIAPKTDVRYYLVGVFVDTVRSRMVSTDGHMMLITKEPREDIPSTANGQAIPPFTIPRATVDVLLKAAPTLGSLPIQFDTETGRIAAECAGVSVLRVDGNYPQYTVVLPTTAEPDPAAEWALYDPALTATMQAALRVACATKKGACAVFQQIEGKGVMFMEGDPDAMGLVMGLRTKAHRQPHPDNIIKLTD